MFKSYFNLHLKPAQDIPRWDVLGRAWREVHRAGAKSAIPFAVAFPEWMKNGYTVGDVLRVFVLDTEQANRLCDAIEPVLDEGDIATVSRVLDVPEKAGVWEAYRMRRLSGPVSKNRKTVLLDAAIEMRHQANSHQRKLQASLPFVWMRSGSGQKFKLVIERVAGDPLWQGEPNGYGLSRATQMIGLPVL